MRLLNVTTKRLESFQGSHVPRYAILSHTWGANEVTFDELTSFWYFTKRLPPKVFGACEQARKDRLSYVWIDSCCINKADVSELTEAINSMSQWYRGAEQCYVYLSDVDWSGGIDETDKRRRFSTSRWFTRGWTLQELLAPPILHFYDKNWTSIGLKSHWAELLEGITGIPTAYLLGRKSLKDASVAQRFSWAAFRETTRIEDIAYCLLGIFGINMPLIYGEGEQAFVRLQAEIIKHGGDQSILAWGFVPSWPPTTAAQSPNRSQLLATHPIEFAHCRSVITVGEQPDVFEIDRQRIRLQLSILRPTQQSPNAFGYLRCGISSPETGQNTPLIVIPMQHTKDNCYVRQDGCRPEVRERPPGMRSELQMAYILPHKPPSDRGLLYVEQHNHLLSESLFLRDFERSWEPSPASLSSEILLPTRISSPIFQICRNKATIFLLYQYLPPRRSEIFFVLAVVYEDRDGATHQRLEWRCRSSFDLPTKWDHLRTERPPVTPRLCREIIEDQSTTILRWFGPDHARLDDSVSTIVSRSPYPDTAEPHASIPWSYTGAVVVAFAPLVAGAYLAGLSSTPETAVIIIFLIGLNLALVQDDQKRASPIIVLLLLALWFLTSLSVSFFWNSLGSALPPASSYIQTSVIGMAAVVPALVAQLFASWKQPEQ